MGLGEGEGREVSEEKVGGERETDGNVTSEGAQGNKTPLNKRLSPVWLMLLWRQRQGSVWWACESLFFPDVCLSLSLSLSCVGEEEGERMGGTRTLSTKTLKHSRQISLKPQDKAP